LYGSRAYVEDHDLSGVLGVLNLDMYGYDSDDDGCFELHVGTLETSAPVGLCMVESIAAYEIPLTFDYFTTGATTASDHSSFWEKGIGAVEIGENFEFNNFADGCVGRDLNPNYHTAGDTIDKLNLPVGFNITKAALATLFNMAGEPPPYYPVFLPILVK
jgi:Zn-dependent M28 family amino/carboxypeptidase